MFELAAESGVARSVGGSSPSAARLPSVFAHQCPQFAESDGLRARRGRATAPLERRRTTAVSEAMEPEAARPPRREAVIGCLTLPGGFPEGGQRNDYKMAVHWCPLEVARAVAIKITGRRNRALGVLPEHYLPLARPMGQPHTMRRDSERSGGCEISRISVRSRDPRLA